MKIRKFQTGGYALTYAAPAATGSAISLTELMAPYFSSAATKLFSLATSAAPAATAVAIPVALAASGIYGTKANQKQVEKGMMPFITSPHAALGYQQTYMSPKKEMTVPSEPLVLRPEYRTVTTPIEYIGYRPLFNSTEVVNEDSTSQEDTTGQQSSTPSPKPNNEKPKDDKGFKKGLKKGWEHTKKIGNTIGTGLGYGIGFGIPAAATIGASYGLYKLFSSDEKDEIKDSDIREIE